MSETPNGSSREALFAVLAPLVALAAVWILGEAVMRVVVSRKLIYNIEMVRYAKTLKIQDPEGVNSHVHRSNKSAKLMGVEVSLNSLGHRGPEPLPKSPKTKRVLVIGSSVTMGWGVPQESIFTSVVQARLNAERPFGPAVDFEFENAGIGNYDSLAQLNLLKRQYDTVKPDLVVLHYFISDAEPRTKGSNNPILKYSYLAAFAYDRARTAAMRAKRVDLTSHYTALYQGDNSSWTKARGYVGEMRDIAKKDGVPFVIMIMPDLHNLQPGTPYAAIYELIEREFKAMNIATVNTFGAFQARFGASERELWIQPDDPHPNGKGHALMAQLLYDFLLARNPLRLSRKS